MGRTIASKRAFWSGRPALIAPSTTSFQSTPKGSVQMNATHTPVASLAPSPEAILAAARRANVPADEVVEVGPAAPELAERMRDWAKAVPSS